jgi:hypothetical protein
MTEVPSLNDLRLNKACDYYLLHMNKDLFFCVLAENEAQDGSFDDVNQV